MQRARTGGFAVVGFPLELLFATRSFTVSVRAFGVVAVGASATGADP